MVRQLLLNILVFQRLLTASAEIESQLLTPSNTTKCVKDRVCGRELCRARRCGAGANAGLVADRSTRVIRPLIRHN